VSNNGAEVFGAEKEELPKKAVMPLLSHSQAFYYATKESKPRS
jgi:hypothetical protein